MTTFRAIINGKTFEFECYTTNTRNGFCHHAECAELGIKARVPYYNRTWESFRYETVLRSCIDKLKTKAVRELHDELIRQIIKGESEKENKRCEECFKAFETLWGNASDKTKERVRRAVGENGVQSEGEMKAVTTMLGALSILGE